MGEAEAAVELSDKLEKLYGEITQLTVVEAAELVKAMEERLGVSAAAPVVVAGMAGAAAGAPEAEAKTSFDVVLKQSGTKKIQIIKAVRELSGLGLKEAKALVDGVPSKIREGVSRDEAEAAKNRLEEQGAVVEIK